MKMAATINLIALSACILFNPASSDDGSLAFMAIGDWGGQDKKPYTTKAEVYIADYMGDVAKDIGSQFTIALGDNFYDDGVSDVYDKRFKETYEDVFTAQSLQSKWYPVCGNHDYHGNCSAQIAYTSYSKRWYFPDFYYTQVFTVPGTSVTLQILFLDTIILTGISDPYDPTIPLGGPLSLDDAEKEWDWIEETLSKSVANWVIVCGHYPVWSAGKHGPTQALVDKLRPMLQKYNVSLYISGHDHNLQYIYEKGHSIRYAVSGAGHGIEQDEDHKSDIPNDSLLFWHAPHGDDSHGGFNSIIVTTQYMNVTFYTAKGIHITLSSTQGFTSFTGKEVFKDTIVPSRLI